MKLILFAALLLCSQSGFSQKQTFTGVAFYTTQSALPFSKFGRVATGVIHPGIEISKRKILKERKKHDWLMEAKASLFYHRFVQLGIPLSLNIGYRYKLTSSFGIDATVGGGYLHSIPAAQKFKLNNDGYYANDKGIGRAQATANLGLAISYCPKPLAKQRLEIFTGYNQLLQFPFIKSYVPLLPYTQLQLGMRKQCFKKSK